MAWEVSKMIHKLHYRHLNNFLSFYYKEINKKSFYKTEIIYKGKDGSKMIKTKVKFLGAIA